MYDETVLKDPQGIHGSLVRQSRTPLCPRCCKRNNIFVSAWACCELSSCALMVTLNKTEQFTLKQVKNKMVTTIQNIKSFCMKFLIANNISRLTNDSTQVTEFTYCWTSRKFIRSLVIMKIETSAFSDRNISSKQTSSTVGNLVPATRDSVLALRCNIHWCVPSLEASSCNFITGWCCNANPLGRQD